MADTVNQFNHRLDKYWKKYDFVYDHRAILKNAVTVSSYIPTTQSNPRYLLRRNFVYRMLFKDIY